MRKTYSELIEYYENVSPREIIADMYFDYKEEIERLNKLISQREKKWEKWTTEKTILSTKMSDYLCKYQNIKREYTKQIKISSDRKKEIERLNNIIKKGIEAINVYQNEKTLSVGYQDLKRIRGILQGNEFDLQMFEEYLQELKGSDEPSFAEMVGFVENVCKDIKSQSTLHEELEEERKTIAKIVGDLKEVNK